MVQRIITTPDDTDDTPDAQYINNRTDDQANIPSLPKIRCIQHVWEKSPANSGFFAFKTANDFRLHIVRDRDQCTRKLSAFNKLTLCFDKQKFLIYRHNAIA